MARATTAALLAFAFLVPSAQAQDAGTRKLNRAIHAQEKEILRYVTQRMEYDKKLKGSTVTVEVQPGGVVVLSGSVLNEAAREWVIELTENTIGVRSIVDELAVVKAAKVYETKTDTAVIEVAKPVVVPVETRIIAKP